VNGSSEPVQSPTNGSSSIATEVTVVLAQSSFPEAELAELRRDGILRILRVRGDASITSPTDSAWPRATRLHPLKAPLAVPRPLPVVIFERLRLMRASFAVLSLSQGASFLFFHMPPFHSLKALESRWCEQGRVMRPRRRPDERRQVETAAAAVPR
jgi:hypothetical protein